jgi:hypothetical protein
MGTLSPFSPFAQLATRMSDRPDMRMSRQTAPGVVHHIISRFVDDRWFIESPAERAQYLHWLGRAMGASDWLCLAYAIMSSHIHLAMVGGDGDAETWMRRVNPPFALWMNARHDRHGPMFAERPSIWLVQDHDVAQLLAYIHNNPVRGGVVSQARDSPWTSHRAYMDAAVAPGWLAVDEGLARAKLGRSEFEQWVNSTVGATFDQPKLGDLRRVVRKHGAIELATPTVGASVPLVIRRSTFIHPDAQQVIARVIELMRLELENVRSRSRHPEHVAARAIAIQAGRRLGVTISHMAGALGLSAQAGSRLGLRHLDEHYRAIVAIVCHDFRAEWLARKVTKEKASPTKRSRSKKSSNR